MIVLHVDRSQFFKNVVKNTSSMEAVDFLNSESIAESLSILEKYNVDLIITGQELADGSARDFLLKINEVSKGDIPVIMITSKDDFETRNVFFKLGVVDFISKSDFSPERLLEHLESFRSKDSLMESLSLSSIAILDDSSLSLQVITSILKIHNIENIDAYSDPEALLESEKQYQIYLLDMVLPRISGEEMVLKLRKRFPLSVIIVISSLDKMNTMAHVLESGADDYVIKPYNARLLMARLKSNYRHFLVNQELEEKKKLLEKMAVTDDLTGVNNHRYLIQRLQEAISHAERRGGGYCFSVLLLDIDHFKKVNDNYGHPVGDEVLRTISRQFISECRTYDIFGRYGGGEFMLIMPDTTLEDALRLSDRMRQKFYETTVPGLRSDHELSFSGGLVEWYNESLEELISKVDGLLYEAKNAGRNRIKS